MATETQERVESDTRADKDQKMRLEIGELQVGQTWIARILVMMCAALFVIFATLLVIAMQL